MVYTITFDLEQYITTTHKHYVNGASIILLWDG